MIREDSSLFKFQAEYTAQKDPTQIRAKMRHGKHNE
jgi:hypothetical protein